MFHVEGITDTFFSEVKFLKLIGNITVRQISLQVHSCFLF